MLVNAREGTEIRIAILEKDRDGIERLEHYFVERTGRSTLVGNIYKGEVTDVRGALQAAFVDIGLVKRGFLHVSEVKTERRAPEQRMIQRLVRQGQSILVQVIRDEFGEKGPSLTTNLSIPGRFLVLMPRSTQVIVAKRLQGNKAMSALARQLAEAAPGIGMIVRTNAETVSPLDVFRDLDVLRSVWDEVLKRSRETQGVGIVYEEPDFVLRTIREFFDERIEEIVIDHEATYRAAAGFFERTMPRYKDRVRHYTSSAPLFHRYGVEAQVQLLGQKEVPLKSGGNLVIEKTEGMTCIDVNSERFMRVRDPEELALRTNLEACVEIMRQLRTRDIGGIIVIDFISMRLESNRRRIEEELKKEGRRDRNQMTILPMSEFGTIEIARQKVRPSVEIMVNEPCPACGGTGRRKDAQSIELEILRMIRSQAEATEVASIEVQAHPDVIRRLSERQAEFAELEAKHRKRVQLLANERVALGSAELAFYNEGGERIMDVMR